eukprot:SAG11_NODE_15726_length_568_cov_0.869936_1_plen_111_part_10
MYGSQRWSSMSVAALPSCHARFSPTPKKDSFRPERTKCCWFSPTYTNPDFGAGGLPLVAVKACDTGSALLTVINTACFPGVVGVNLKAILFVGDPTGIMKKPRICMGLPPP